MKKTISLTIALLVILCIQLNAQKNIAVELQMNSQTGKYKDNTNSYNDKALGLGIGLRLQQKIAKIPLLLEPRFMYHKSGTLASSTTISNFKTSYIQLPVSVNLLSFKKGFIDDESGTYGESKSFHFGLNVGLYVGYGIGGSFKNGTVQKMKYGNGSTDNRAPMNYGLHTQFSFATAANGNGFTGYIEMQRGFNNVVPSARVTNGASRKLNNFNVGAAFRIRTRK
jgi:hypothetical protein